MKCGAGTQAWGSVVLDAQPPAIQSGGVVSASAFGQFRAIAPGSWLEIYGSNLSTGSREWAGADFSGVNAPVSLEGTSVRIGGPVLSSGLILTQLPFFFFGEKVMSRVRVKI